MQRRLVGSNRQTSVAPPGHPGGDTGVPFQRPPRFMDRGAQTWGSTAAFSNGAYAPTAAYVPRGPVDLEQPYGVPLTGFRSRTPRND
ncbi:MAG: hypothetical protein Q7T55_26545 [Solirubrobacteraceae bacterium]|nr:hypothetical protein [Solirubrobacteraceae bacterium]